MSDVLVYVRQYSDGYIARAGSGKGAKIASSTNCGPVAAQAAAGKFLQCDSDKVVLEKHAPGVFRATVAIASAHMAP